MRTTARLVALTLLVAAAATPARAAAAGRDPSRVTEEAAAAGKAPLPEGRKAAKKPLVPIAWRNHLDAAKHEAAQRGGCVLLYFRADWCKPCGLMEDGVFTIPAIAQYMNQHFVPVRIDDSDGTSETSTTYAIRVYPSVLFLDPGYHFVETIGTRDAV